MKSCSLAICCPTRNKGFPRSFPLSLYSTISYGKRVCALINAFKVDGVRVPRHVSVNGVFSPRADMGCCLLSPVWGNLFVDSPLNKNMSDESLLSESVYKPKKPTQGSNVKCSRCII